jgi:alpha-beta hydrolase superfamily lysophospholipase
VKRRDYSLVGKGGVIIKYDVYEPADAARGVVLVAHGLGEHGRRYAHVAERLAGVGLLVVVPDHRGHGRSEGPRAGLKRFADYTDDFHAVVRAVTTSDLPVFVVGHSMGGTIALEYALHHQDELAGLVLSAAAVQPGDQPKLLLQVAKLLSRVAPGLPTAKLETAAISRDPEVVRAYEADPMVFHGKVPAGLGGGMLRLMDTFPSRLARLHIPVLVLHGADDRLTSPEGSRLVHAGVGSADKELTIYPGLYHEIFNEPERDMVLDDVARWLVAHL